MGTCIAAVFPFGVGIKTATVHISDGTHQSYPGNLMTIVNSFTRDSGGIIVKMKHGQEFLATLLSIS